MDRHNRDKKVVGCLCAFFVRRFSDDLTNRYNSNLEKKVQYPHYFGILKLQINSYI
jgi:hypothetical protein